VVTEQDIAGLLAASEVPVFVHFVENISGFFYGDGVGYYLPGMKRLLGD